MGFQSASDRGLPVAERYSVAIVTLDEEMFRDMRRALAPNFRATLASTESQIKTLIDDADTHGIVLDLESIGEDAADGIEVLQEMRRLRDDLIMVAITVSTGSELPLHASQAGADHFFLKPVDGLQLRTVLLQTLEKRALQFEGQWLLEQVENRSAFCGLIGGSESMRKVYQAIEAVAGSNASVVISGESGVGKELVAQAIVQSGERHDKPYVCLNCSALPETLIESELFGYEKGAFTGADSAKPGLIELAHTGTLFLDEITTLNLGLQSKLLRALQERSVQRLGGKAAKKIEFIAYAKANPSKLSMASPGTGTVPHIAGEYFKMMANVDMVHVPYRGGAQALSDLMAGHVQAAFMGPAASIALIRSGKIRALAVTSNARAAVLPEVPTISEVVPGYEASQWFGVVAPKNTPSEIIDKLNTLI